MVLFFNQQVQTHSFDTRPARLPDSAGDGGNARPGFFTDQTQCLMQCGMPETGETVSNGRISGSRTSQQIVHPDTSGTAVPGGWQCVPVSCFGKSQQGYPGWKTDPLARR